MSIHKMALIHPDAKIGKNVTIDAFATVAADVVIGDDSWIGSNAVIADGARLGKHCRVFPGASVSSIPQDLKFKGEKTTLEIGENVTIREFCTLNRGTEANGRTIIGDNCLLMAYVHVAHDCIIGKNCILANNVTLAGHIEIGDFTVLGGFVAIHQFVQIGAHVMVGGAGKVRKDIPPFIKADREPLSYVGVNSTGLVRRGYSRGQINAIQDCYRFLFVRGLNVKQAISAIENEILPSSEREIVLDFLKKENRGILPGPRLNGAKFKHFDEDSASEHV
jgi:UDP-N-acetylglucosamine acyltransferase